MRQTVKACIGAVLFVASLAAAADQQVNTQASLDQKDPSLTASRQGSGMVVWNSYRQDGESGGIFGRSLGLTGPVGPEFQVNATAAGNQAEPTVAVDGDGTFLVAWRGPWGEAESEAIVARVFDPNVKPLTDDLHVNTHIAPGQGLPRAAACGLGRFIVVWESRASQDAARPCIRGQLLDQAGRPIGSEIAVSDTAYAARYPDVAMDGRGRFAVVWLEDRTTDSVLVRLFDADGAALAGSFKANITPFKSVTRPCAAMNEQGTFILGWDGHPDKASEDDVHARLFDPNGEPLTTEILVNTTLAGAQVNPRVAMNSHGQSLVVWEGPSSDPNSTDVFCQYLDAAGKPVGEELRLNGFLAGNQTQPIVWLGDQREYVAVWESALQDGSGSGIFAATGQLPPVADPNADGIAKQPSPAY